MVNAFLASTVMQNAVETYHLLKKSSDDGGLLGEKTDWAKILTFEAAEQHDTSTPAQTAEQNGTASTYTLYVDRSIHLACGDRIRREDGTVFEVMTNSADAQAPAESRMNLCAVKCRKGVLD